jgi:endonuclease/exonuclease/phosphatase family metal-dependent hydrolase
MTYNVHGLGAGLDTVAGVIADVDPDIALLQECGSRSGVVRLAEALGMDADATHRPFSRVRNAVLFRPPWRNHRRQVWDFERQGRALPRGFIAVNLRREDDELGPQQSLTAVSTHLGLVPNERTAHARELTDFLAGEESGVIVGGDLNESPDGSAATWLGERLFDVWPMAGEGPGLTFPTLAPSARIDYLFLSEGFEVIQAWVAGGPLVARASDHRPLVANLEGIRS